MLKRTRNVDPCEEDATGFCAECVALPPKGIPKCMHHLPLREKRSAREERSKRRKRELTQSELNALEDMSTLGLEVGTSTIPNAGSGLFATRKLAMHTVLGVYRVSSLPKMKFYAAILVGTGHMCTLLVVVFTLTPSILQRATTCDTSTLLMELKIAPTVHSKICMW